MAVVLMRHGDAVIEARSDFDRVLSATGTNEVMRSAHALIERNPGVTHVIASPLVRAQQTASLVSEHLGMTVPVATWKEIFPDGDPEVVAPMLDVEVGLPLVVTHQPFVSMLIEYMTGEAIRVLTANLIYVDNGNIGWTFEP